MAEFKPTEIKVDGIEDIRRLSAALEQFNANNPQGPRTDETRLRMEIEQRAIFIEQVAPRTKLEAAAHDLIKAHLISLADHKRTLGRETEMRAELDSKRHQLAEALDSARAAELEQHNAEKRADAEIAKLTSRASVAENANRELRAELEKVWAEAGELRETLSHSRTLVARRGAEIDQFRAEADRAAKTHESQADTIRKQRDELHEMQLLLNQAKYAASEAVRIIQGKRSVVLLRGEINDPLLRGVSDVLRVLTSSSATINKLQQDLSRRNVEAGELRRAAEQRDEVIKHLHAEFHELEARKQVVQFELDRAQDEIAAAEAEIAQLRLKGAAQCL